MDEEVVKPVRVLRVLEYIYASAEDAVADMHKWKVQGEYIPSSRMKIVSRSFPMEMMDEPLPKPVYHFPEYDPSNPLEI